MNKVVTAEILAWCPEFMHEKTMLLAIEQGGVDVDVAESLLESGPVSTEEPGFYWTEEPGMCVGLTVWRGVIEAEEDGKFYFQGKWHIPTPADLSYLAGLDIKARIS